jgi:SAM-dependent methyltransferase
LDIGGDDVRRMGVFDDEIWQALPEDRGDPPQHLAEFVRGLGPAKRALDLGCGDGWLTELIESEHVVGVDPSWTALGRARTRLPHARLIPVAPDERLVLEDNAFDLVLCTETLEHVRDTQLFLSEARRVLEPGGRLAVSTPAHGRDTALRIADEGWGGFFDPLSPHLRFYSEDSLRSLLEAQGFGVQAMETREDTLLAVATR